MANPHPILELAAVQGRLNRHSCESPSFATYSTNKLQASLDLDRFPGPYSPEVLEKNLAYFVSKLQSYQQSWEGIGKGQCPGPRGHLGIGDQDSMSQRPPASRPASHSPPAPQKITLPPVQLRDDVQHGGREGGRQLPEVEGRGLPQPSPQFPRSGQTTPLGEGWRLPATSRDLGVHSMLNPTEPETSGPTDRRPRGPPSESPSFATRPSPQFGNSPTMAPSHTFSTQQQSSGTSSMTEGFGGSHPRARRILTPRSPARTLSAVRGGAHHIDASRSPFLTGRARAYTSDIHGYVDAPSSSTPPLPQGHSQQHYGFPPSVPQPLAPRRASGGTMHAPGQMPPSQSASPSISASSHNPSSNQTSPASFPYKGQQASQSATPYFPGSSFGSAMQQGGGIQYQEATGAPEGPYSTQAPSYAQEDSSLHSSSAGSSRQTSASDPIQVLTITTLEGHFNVPVDVHQASKLADEKRKRNAGASARFRQRRKDKEKEATTNIDKLNQQARDLERRVREVEEERDFYRKERNRFRDVVYRTPETRHLAQGPPSPLTMQSTTFPSQQGGPPGSMGFHPGPTSPQERAPRRRRTDVRGDFASIQYSASPSSSLPPVQSTLSGLARSSGPPSLPPLRMENPAPQRTSGPGVTTPSTEAPQPPYAAFPRGPYERGWPPGDAGRR